MGLLQTVIVVTSTNKSMSMGLKDKNKIKIIKNKYRSYLKFHKFINLVQWVLRKKVHQLASKCFVRSFKFKRSGQMLIVSWSEDMQVLLCKCHASGTVFKRLSRLSWMPRPFTVAHVERLFLTYIIISNI